MLGAALVCVASATATSQQVPTTQPAIIRIIREQVKAGRDADHEKFEMGWPAAYTAAKSTFNYIALTTLTGPHEAWYVQTFPSNASIGQSMKEEDSNPVLSAELARLSKGDAEYITGFNVIQAAARPDLSYGAFPNIGKNRFWAITLFRTHPGHEAQFEAAAKAYAASAKRNAPSTSFRTYQVIAGMQGPVFIIFGSVESYADFDQTTMNGTNIMAKATADETAALQKYANDGMVSAETERFRLNAPMSFVNKTTQDADPAFWLPKKAATKKP
jgi:hypothetical protein